MDQINNGWFSEINEMWPGQSLSLKVDQILHQEKSKYQDILLFKSTSHGNVLVLDGIIQCAERDEFAYQETIALLPLCAHPNPEKVLIVGGGDGGVAREVAKHPAVKNIEQVEIDDRVIALSKLYLPNMAKGFDSPKVNLHVADGFQYIKDHKTEFDVVITDSSDPIGPAACLFQEEYFELLRKTLKQGGIICSQAGTIWLDDVKPTLINCRKHFPGAKYANVSVPTYPTGHIGYIIGCTDMDVDVSVPRYELAEETLESMGLRYYSPEVHRAAFVLPRWAAKDLASEE